MTFQIDPAVRSNNICEKVMGARSAFAKQVLERYNDGLSIKQLMDEFGVSDVTIYRLLNQAESETGIKRQKLSHGRSMTTHQIKLAASMLERGWSAKYTAKKVGVTGKTILDRKNGSPPPSQWSSFNVQHKERVIRELEERINRMERMAKNGFF